MRVVGLHAEPVTIGVAEFSLQPAGTPAGAARMGELRTLALVDALLARPAETAWLEFKENNTDPRLIGRMISAISNAARIAGRDFGYVVWG